MIFLTPIRNTTVDYKIKGNNSIRHGNSTKKV